MIISNPATTERKARAIALGNFDGIHQGHRVVLQPVLEPALLPASINIPNNLSKAVVSFSPHPREFFSQQPLPLLTPKQEKAGLLADLGFDELILIPFDKALANLSPRDFVGNILVSQLQAQIISVGADFRFGKARSGTAQELKTTANQHGIAVEINSLHKYRDLSGNLVRVSSSLIRQALSRGEIIQANQMLGRAYSLRGKVVTGQQIGRTIGFPTANLDIAQNKFLPRFGVYAVTVHYQQQNILGVMNIGCRPTVAGEAPTIEVHLLDWSGNLYNQELTVTLEAFLRPEQKFASLDALKSQIQSDCQQAKELVVGC